QYSAATPHLLSFPTRRSSDLSKVMFIATANNLSEIQGPLRDRMELIEVNGYTIEEKIEIAKRHLLPKQLEEHGISKKELSIDRKDRKSTRLNSSHVKISYAVF